MKKPFNINLYIFIVFIFCLIVLLGACFGQYPKLVFDNKGKIVRYQDTTKPKVYYGIAGIKTDSTKIFWKKYLLFRKQIDSEIVRISHLPVREMNVKYLLRLQDSALKYELKLDKLKK